jgi:hypothetical protein
MEMVGRLEGDGPLDFEQLLPTPKDLLDGDDDRETDLFPGWYAWRREHWGVKWNASSVRRRGYGRSGRVRYRFVTPYGPPLEFLDHVGALYPMVQLRLEFEVEMLGRGGGAWHGGRRKDHWQELS